MGTITNMAISRYDHRKLAFHRRKRRQSRKGSTSVSPELIDSSEPHTEHGGYLGKSTTRRLSSQKGGKPKDIKWRKVAFEKEFGHRGEEKCGSAPGTPRDGRRVSTPGNTPEGRRDSCQVKRDARRASVLPKKNAT